MTHYREIALQYIADYRSADKCQVAYIEQLLISLADEDLAVLEELLIFAGER